MRAWLRRFFLRKVWIVYEDCHGAVSWWTSKRKAYKEANRLLKDGCCPGCDYECNNHSVDECDAITVHWEYLNKKW